MAAKYLVAQFHPRHRACSTAPMVNFEWTTLEEGNGISTHSAHGTCLVPGIYKIWLWGALQFYCQVVVGRVAMTLRTAKPESKRIVPLGEERWDDWLFQDNCVLRKINLRNCSSATTRCRSETGEELFVFPVKSRSSGWTKICWKTCGRTLNPSI